MVAPCDRRMADDGLLEAVRGLHLAHPELGPKPLLAKLRQQQPDLAAGNKEVLRQTKAVFDARCTGEPVDWGNISASAGAELLRCASDLCCSCILSGRLRVRCVTGRLK